VRRFGWMLAALCCFQGIDAQALVIDGQEVQDLYGYILRVLEEDARVQAEFREQALSNPTYRGYRPHTFSSLRHMTTEDVLYGAAQGAYMAIRYNRDGSPEVVAAKAEANIGVVMELFPMLVRDFETGGKLVALMQGKGTQDYFQIYLLKRAIPGITSPSLFSEYWQEAIQQHWPAFVKAIEFLLENYSTSPEAAALAIRIYETIAEQEFLDWLEQEPGVREWMAKQPEPRDLRDAAAKTEAIAAVKNKGALNARLKALSKSRQLIARQTEDDLNRLSELRQTARDTVARIDAAYPMLLELEAEPNRPRAPTIPGPPRDDNAPITSTQPTLGIPTLGF